MEITPPIAALYARSADARADLTAQIRTCRECAESHGYTIPAEFVFADRGASGRTTDRPEFQRLLTTLANGAPFDRLFVTNLSRIERCTNPRIFGDCTTVFARSGIQIQVADVAYRTAKRRAVLHGAYPGAHTPFGMARVLVAHSTGEVVHTLQPGKTIRLPGTFCTLRPATDGSEKVVREIFKLLAQGLSAHVIAQYFTEKRVPGPKGRTRWTAAKVRRIGRHPIYMGTLIWRSWRADKTTPTPHTEAQAALRDPIIYDGFVPDPIVSREQFEAVQAILDA